MRQFLLLIALSLAACSLAACSGPPLPFKKEEASGDAAIRPPWEALVQAGPGADNDLDFETLDGPLAQPRAPDATEPAAPEQAIENADGGQAQAADVPKPRKTGPAIKAVAVPVVIGAKGKGNSELTAAMRNVLKEAGWPVQAGRSTDALLITGKVTLGSAEGPEQKVKLVWTVAGPDGKVLGEIVQENAVATGSLDQGWGENAQFASEAAAEGIFKLIQGFR